MLAIKTRTLWTIRYLRPDHNPLRRPVDRAHSRLVVTCAATMLTAGPLAVTAVARSVYDTGLRTERRQTAARHPVEATIVGAPSGEFRFGAIEKTTVRWRDATGVLRSGTVPPRGGDEPGVHRTVWLDQAGRTTSPPNTHAHTVVHAVAASAGSAGALGLLVIVGYLVGERRLDRRRSASWEREWTNIAPRWTGRPRHQD